MTTDATRAHIDAERLAAWADHGLSATDAADVELHLSQCERCQEVLAAFVRSEAAPAVVIPFFARRPVRWSAAGLAAAAALFLMVRTGESPSVPTTTAPVPDSVVAREESGARVAEATKPTAAAAEELKRERRSAEGAARDVKSALADRAELKQAAANEQATRKEQPRQAAMPAAPPPPARPADTPPPVPARATAPPPVAVVAASPVVAPPASATALGRAAGGIPAMSESVVIESTRGVIEIFAPGPAVLRRMAAQGAGGGGGGGGAAGRGGAAPSAFRAEITPARWRIVLGMRVELSLDAGATWTVLPIEPALTSPLVAGVAAGPSVCWLVGPEGVVLLTTDGRTFRRVSLSERVRLVSITAEDGLQATVTAADGRKFSTVDGGLTWK